MQDYAEPLRRGAFLAEVPGRIALELQAMAILGALCAGVRPVVAGRSAGGARAPRRTPSLHFIQGHSGEHGQYEHKGLLATAG